MMALKNIRYSRCSIIPAEMLYRILKKKGKELELHYCLYHTDNYRGHFIIWVAYEIGKIVIKSKLINF
jgi:hypothetical protein